MTASLQLLRYASWLFALQPVAGFTHCQPLDRPQPEPRDIVRKMAGTYDALASPLMIRVEATRRQVRGATVHEVKRLYRLVQGSGRIRIDVLPDKAGATRTTLLDNGSDLLLYMQEPKRYYRATREDPASALIEATIANIRHGLYSRWSGLAASEYTAHSLRRGVVTIERSRYHCYRIDVKSQNPTDGEWSGEVWIDEERSVPRRARLRRMADGAIMEEDLTWSEMLTGDSVPVHDLHWVPDAAAQVMKTLPPIIPH